MSASVYKFMFKELLIAAFERANTLKYFIHRSYFIHLFLK